MRDNLEKFMAGFHGHDAMRDKAMRMLGHEIRATDMRTPESMSSPGRTKMRPFRKGGHAVHRISQEQSDLHIPRRVKSAPFRKAVRRAEGGEMYSEGGETRAEGGAMRRGGHAKRHKYGLGGMIAGAAGAPVLNKIPKVGKYMAQNLGMFGGLLPFAEGGHADGGAMRRGGHARRKHRAEGGMMGMEPEVSTFNEGGEAKRRGGAVRRKHRAEGGLMQDPTQEPLLIANAKRRWMDNHPDGALYAEGGEAKRRGGRIHRRHRAEGGEMYNEGGEARAEGGAMRRGGHARKYTKDGHPKFGIGGFFGDLMRSIPLVNMVTGPIADAAHLKKGGKVSRRCHRAEGGMMGISSHQLSGGIGAPYRGPLGTKIASQSGLTNPGGGPRFYAEGGEAKRRGGSMRKKHRAEGGEAKFGVGGDLATAAGAYRSFSPETRQRIGNVGKNLWNAGKAAFGYADGGYAEGGEAPFSNARRGGHMKNQREMVGEHPSRKRHHFNYESEMKGQHPIRRAAGGAAKVRHGQATRSGHPIHRRVVKGR